MNVQAFETRLFRRDEDLVAFVLEAFQKPEARTWVREKMILAVTSKIVSLAEGAILVRGAETKEEIVRAEADRFYGAMGYGSFLTMKHGLLLPSAGIDESNSETGDYILFPKDPYASAKKLWSALREAWGLKELGVILTDSHTSPLRRGVTGIGLSHWGFRAVRNQVGETDLFGRELKMTQINFLDALSAAAVLMMGETREQRPVAVIQNVAGLEFRDTVTVDEIAISPENDLYMPIFGLTPRVKPS